MSDRNLLVCACGSGNVTNLPNYLHALRRQGRVIRVLMTYSAAEIMPPATVRLVADEVYTDADSRFDPGHVTLATWASQLVVLPATAHLIAQAANGMAGNLVATTLLAYERRAVFFPSMNWRMWQNTVVQRNVAQLRADGHLVVEPEPETCWEIATSSLRTALGLPPPIRAAEIFEAALTVFSNCEKREEGQRTGTDAAAGERPPTDPPKETGARS